MSLEKMIKNKIADKFINDAIKYGQKYNLNKTTYTGTDDETDALRHAYMQAYLTLWLGENFAKKQGNKHEFQGSNNDKSMNMDLWNNEIGRTIGKDIYNRYKNKEILVPDFNDEIAKEVVNRIKKGELITSPNVDNRHYHNIPYEKLKQYLKEEMSTGHAANIDTLPSKDDNVQLNNSTPSIENPYQIPQNDMINHIFDREMKNYRQNKLQTPQESFAQIQQEQDDNLSELDDYDPLNTNKKRKKPRIPKLQTLSSDKLDWYMKNYI